MTQFSSPEHVPVPTFDPSNGRVLEGSVTGFEPRQMSRDPGTNDGGVELSSGMLERAARVPRDALGVDEMDVTGSSGRFTGDREELMLACIRGVCAIGCVCGSVEEGLGNQKKGHNKTFIFQSPRSHGTTHAGPRGRFWADGPTPELASPSDQPVPKRGASRKRSAGSATLPTAADWLAIAEAVQASQPRGRTAAAASRASKTHKETAKRAKVSGDPTPAREAPENREEVSNIRDVMEEGEGVSPGEQGMVEEGDGSGNSPHEAAAARAPKPATAAVAHLHTTTMNMSSGDKNVLEEGVVRGGAQGGGTSKGKEKGGKEKKARDGMVGSEGGHVVASGGLASPRTSRSSSRSALADRLQGKSKGQLNGSATGKGPAKGMATGEGRGGNATGEEETGGQLTSLDDQGWSQVGPRGKIIPSTPPPAPPAPKTPRQLQADKRERDEREQWGSKGSKEYRNTYRSSRAAPPAATAPPTSWMGLLCPPKPVAPADPSTTTVVIADGLPASWGLAMVLQAIRSAMNSVEELADLMAESIHRLPAGGWLMTYSSVEEVQAFLCHAHRIVVRSGDEIVKVDFHLPGAASARQRAAEDLRSRQAFASLPRELATDLARTSSQSPGPAAESAAATLQEWIGDDGVKVRMIGANGGAILTFASEETAKRAIAAGGVPLRRLGLKLRIREFLSREEASVVPCTRCCLFGHTEARCSAPPRCRTCGQHGHSEIRGRCPKRTQTETENLPVVLHCVACGQDGHKHGAPSCPELQAARRALAPRPGARVQERMRELLAQPPSPQVASESSATTPQVARSFLEVAARAQRKVALRTPRSVAEPTEDPQSVQMDTDEVPQLSTSSRSNVGAPRQAEHHSTSPLHCTAVITVAAKILGDLEVVGARLTRQPSTDINISPEDMLEALRIAFAGMTELLKAIATSSSVVGTSNLDSEATGYPLFGQ